MFVVITDVFLCHPLYRGFMISFLSVVLLLHLICCILISLLSDGSLCIRCINCRIELTAFFICSVLFIAVRHRYTRVQLRALALAATVLGRGCR
jgi:hypothetical protein